MFYLAHILDICLHKDDSSVMCISPKIGKFSNILIELLKSDIFISNNSIFLNYSIIKMAQTPPPSNSDLKEYDFVYCFRPFYYFSRICGYMPFCINFDSICSIHRPVVKICDILWFIIAIILYHLMALDHFVYVSNVAYSSSKVLNSSGWLVMVSSMIFGVIGIVMDMVFRSKFVDTLNKFNRIDEKVCLVCISAR